MRLLITGAAGMLGSTSQPRPARPATRSIALSRAELDVTDRGAVAEAARGEQRRRRDQLRRLHERRRRRDRSRRAPRAVNGSRRRLRRGGGRRAPERGSCTSRPTTCSTGPSGRPYVESDLTGPLSVYGASKLAGEQAVAPRSPGLATRSSARSWLFGTGGPCFPATMLRLAAERDELTVVDDQRGCPTFTGHLAQALVRARRGAGTCPAGSSTSRPPGECSWFEFATEIMRAGASTPVDVRPSTHRGVPAPGSAARLQRAAHRARRRGAVACPTGATG